MEDRDESTSGLRAQGDGDPGDPGVGQNGGAPTEITDAPKAEENTEGD